MTKIKKKQIDWRIALCAIICLTVMEIYAMSLGINGTMRTIIFSLIALIVGVTIPVPQLKVK